MKGLELSCIEGLHRHYCQVPRTRMPSQWVLDNAPLNVRVQLLNERVPRFLLVTRWALVVNRLDNYCPAASRLERL